MAKQLINIGAAPFDNTGDFLREGGEKINANFDELYGVVDNITEDEAGDPLWKGAAWPGTSGPSVSEFVDVEYISGTPKLPLGEAVGEKVKWTVDKETGEIISSFGTAVAGTRKYLWLSIVSGYVTFSITALGSNGIFQTGLKTGATYSRYTKSKATDYYFICDCLASNQWLLTEVGNLTTTSVISEDISTLQTDLERVSNEGKNIEAINMADFVALKSTNELTVGRNYKITDFTNYKGTVEPILLMATANNNFSLLAKSTIDSNYNIWIKPVLLYTYGGYFTVFFGNPQIEFISTKVIQFNSYYDEFLTRYTNSFSLRARDGNANEILLLDTNYGTHWVYDDETHQIALIGEYETNDFDFEYIYPELGPYCLISFANQVSPYWQESRREAGILVSHTYTQWQNSIDERFDTSNVYSDITLVGNATLNIAPEYEPINIPNTTKKYIILNDGEYVLTLGAGITIVSGEWDSTQGHTNILELTYFAIDKVYAVIYSNVIKQDVQIQDSRVNAAVQVGGNITENEEELPLWKGDEWPSNSEAAKLAISITTAELRTAITNSTLIPNQWYLLTDFQNICTIADSQITADYTTGDVEQIYVKALSTNTLQREAISKTFPDEIVEFNPMFSDVTASLYLYAHGDGADVINEETNFTADTYGTSVNELQLGGTSVDEFDDATIGNIYYYNEVSGNEFDLYGYEKDNIWEYDDVNDIFKINKTPYNYYDTYESGSSSFFTISITDATHFVLGCPAWLDFTNQRPDNSSFYLSDGVNGETYDFNQKGVTWDYDAGTDTITILSGSVSLTDPNLSMEFSGISYCDNTAYNTQFSSNGLLDLSVSGSVFEIYSSYVVYSTKGKIEARRNIKFDFYCQADYRVQKVRRYKALCNNWSAGTYNPGDIVRYSGYIYICLKTTTQTPSTSATNWFRLFGDNYNLSNSISIACSVQSINASLAIDPASYTDMYICNDKISNFDAFTEKINTQILKHPDADQTKPLNVTFYAGFHGCQNATITANETHFISNITNSTVNFVNSVLNSAINYSTITSGQYCILWQNTYLNALQLYQVLSSSIDYTTIIIASGSIFRNGIIKSIMTSVSNTIFAAKPTECNIINLSITDQWGSSFSGNYINKMYNCSFNSSVNSCQFNGETYYTNWYGNCYRNKFMSNVYGSSNTVRQTFYYMADNFFAQHVALNYFSTTGGDINSNKFFGSFSNNFTAAIPSYPTYTISANVFNGDFTYNTGGGRFSITNNFAYGFKYNQFNNSVNYYARIAENFFGGDFGGSDVGNTFNNTTADFNIRYNASTNVWYQNTFTRGSIEYNTFLGRVSINIFGGATTQAFTYNVCSPFFSNNTIDANVSKNHFPPYYQNYTINSTNVFNYANMVNGFVKNTYSTSSDYIVEDQYSVIYATSTTNPRTITLPAAKGSKRLITIVKTGGVEYPVTIDGNSNDTINGSLTYTLNKRYQAVTLQDKETGIWYVVDGYGEVPYIDEKRIPYGNSDGDLTTRAGFEYDDSTDTLGAPNIVTNHLTVEGTETESIIATYRDKDGEDIFTALGSIEEEDFEFKIGDYADAGNGTGYKLDYANKRHIFKNDLDVVGNIKTSGSIKVENDIELADVTKAGCIRYHGYGNKTNVDICMRTGVSEYTWVNLIQSVWPITMDSMLVTVDNTELTTDINI